MCGTPLELEMDYAVDNFLLVSTFHAAYLPKPKAPILGLGGVQTTFKRSPLGFNSLAFRRLFSMKHQRYNAAMN